MGIHDALFKHTFAQPEHASGALQAVLPAALSERIDWSTLSLSAGSFVDEALKDCHSDLLWSVRLGDRDALIYVLAEHRSEPDERMPFRMLRYMVRIWDAHLAELPKDERARARLPLIVPQVSALAALFRYILEASPNVLPEELRALVASEVSMEAQEAVMTAGQRLREEGRTEGRNEGRNEGRLDERRALVAKLLRLRFGPLSDDVAQRIDSADGGLLERWAERFATAQSLAEVFSD